MLSDMDMLSRAILSMSEEHDALIPVIVFTGIECRSKKVEEYSQKANGNLLICHECEIAPANQKINQKKRIAINKSELTVRMAA
ncbi:Hypothetical predicted protein [Podarcis lilfordi]|uniref:Uncharacterized protein n=1 Tax=Podarcis lilfordi TaxID=74358 RepID=A0AA35KZ58_9SAUR|nr:Hypothetical predicted protein [Podarcis lilfordi]